jgi:acyl-CoA synthetase (AMP-forming)/AMP-acid ligase II
LHTTKLNKGDRVLLVFFPGLDFTASLLACFKAGLIAVPVFPPDPRKLKKDLHHFISIQTSSSARVALTNQQFNFVKKVEDIKNIFSTVKWPELRWIAIDDQLKKGKALVSKNTAIPSYTVPSVDTIAFLQYTSGSTSEPKGVMISHGNLAHNLTLIIRELKADVHTVNVSWLPQYHDMGLIGSYLGIIYCGGTGYYMSPISFLKDPVLWLKAISKYSGTHTQVQFLM